LKEFVLLLPEIFLAITLLGILMGEVAYHGERLRLVSITALLGLTGAFIQVLLTYQYGASQIFGQAVSIDGLSLFFKLFFILLAGLAVGGSLHSREIPPSLRSEYSALIIGSALAMCLASSASDLLLAFTCLQLMNILGYFLAGYGKRSSRSTEAAIKHLGFGVVSAALLLYGMAVLFMATHTINIYEMHRALLASPMPKSTALVVFMLIFSSLSFQFAAFPMHLWAPDVLEGAPTPASGFLSLGTRAAGLAVALRLFLVVFAQPALLDGQWDVLGPLDWPRIVALVSGITMLLGALLAFRQKSAKRLVAYLVVAETGFLLLGLLVLDEVGVTALLYNLVVELFALMGAYYTLSFLVNELRSDRLEDLKGMLSRAVPECSALILFLICLVGIPPLPGFVGKFALIGAVVRHQWNFLALVGVVSIAISTAAVARLAFSMVGSLTPRTDQLVVATRGQRAFLAILFIPMVLVGMFAEQVLGWAGQSLRFIFW
jgi:NADH-quinone oxidoreductase subunit N